MLPGETLCKMVQIFPPKVLVYTRKIFLDAIFYMFNWKLVRENSKHETFVVFWKTIKYNTKLIDLFV